MPSKKEIKEALQKYDLFTDEMLIDYIEMLLSSSATPEHMKKELESVLSDSTHLQLFIDWLYQPSDMVEEDEDFEITIQSREPTPKKKPIIKTSEPSTFTVTLNGAGEGLKSENGQKLKNPVEVEENKKSVRCVFWPNCKNGAACEYHHPQELCKNFPKCQYGAHCLFIHPALNNGIQCKFGSRCTNSNCQYVHPSGPIRKGKQNSKFTPFTKKKSETICKDFPDCQNKECPFFHPGTEPCKFGEQCTNYQCQYRHPLTRPLPDAGLTKAQLEQIPCKFQEQCKKMECPYLHYQPRVHISDRMFTTSETAMDVQQLIQENQ